MTNRVFWLSLSAVLLTWKLLLPGFIGMADNGDYRKISGPLCLGHEGGENYFPAIYARGPQNCAERESLSSEQLPATLASAVQQAFGAKGSFDIRWLGALHALLFLAVFWAVLRMLDPLAFWPRQAMSLAALWIFADIGTLAYFNTFYADTTAILGGLAPPMLVVPMMAESRGGEAPGGDGPLNVAPPAGENAVRLAFFTFAALLFVTSKPQHAFLSLPLAGFCWWFARKTQNWKLQLAGIAILGAGLFILVTAPAVPSAQARFNVIFSKILPESPDPSGTLQELNLAPADSQYIGSNAFRAGAPARPGGYSPVLSYYLRHPQRTLHIMATDLTQSAPQRRALELANFSRASGHAEGTATQSFGSWSALRTAVFRWNPWLVVVWYLLLLPMAVWAGSANQPSFRGALAWTILGVSLMAVMEYGIASLADGAETPGRLLMFHLFTDVTFFLALALVLVLALVRGSAAMNRRWATRVSVLAMAALGVSLVAYEATAGRRQPGVSNVTSFDAADDRDSGIHYSEGWGQGLFRSAYRETLTFSNKPGAWARFSFTGTSFQYTYTKAFNRGIALVLVDGREQGKVDLYDPSAVWQASTVFSGLTAGTHEVEIRVLGEHRQGASGDYVDIDAISNLRH